MHVCADGLLRAKSHRFAAAPKPRRHPKTHSSAIALRMPVRNATSRSQRPGLSTTLPACRCRWFGCCVQACVCERGHQCCVERRRSSSGSAQRAFRAAGGAANAHIKKIIHTSALTHAAPFTAHRCGCTPSASRQGAAAPALRARPRGREERSCVAVQVLLGVVSIGKSVSDNSEACAESFVSVSMQRRL